MLHKGNVSSLPQLNEKPGQEGFLLALGLGIPYRHLCVFKFLLTLTSTLRPAQIAVPQADTTEPTYLACGACASCSGLLMFPVQSLSPSLTSPTL